MRIHFDCFHQNKGLYELVQTAYEREVSSLVLFKTWLKDVPKKTYVGNGKKKITPLVFKTVQLV